MTITISSAHAAAALEACRVPALQARLALLVSSDATRSKITFYGGTMPANCGETGETALAAAQLSQRAGVVDTDAVTLVLDTPVEGQVVGAEPTNGTNATWARITAPDGSVWADMDVGDEASGAAVKMASTLLLQGAFVRVASVVVEG